MSAYVKSKCFEKRGSQYTIYDSRDFNIHFVQDKITKSYQGVVRGFHGDNKTWKLITCLYGKIRLITYDVYTDQKMEYIIDGNSNDSISVLVPANVLNAHQCLSAECIFHYKWSEFYTSPEDQWSVNFNDKTINPGWDLDLIRYDFDSAISERDQKAASLLDLQKRLSIK